ncbi:hypothetical protein [Caulobacter sp. RL271]|uniref:DUF6311 domain-containing protein n=1 Tax=Caulobacter segnis TaxID=88688 RepID=A0ABY4ZQ28_9CAUL|nr:hypothetical protein [Caulobacter segnis]USQ94770.1 hypothetical protein MZV50_19670 [Caulobacter segnis]
MDVLTRPMLLSALAGALLFGWTIGFDALLASGRAWVTPRFDMAAMMTGYYGFLNAPWSLRPTVVQGLGGQPLSIVFTDSVPWVSLLLKALHLGRVLNPLGLILFVSYILQPLGAISLLRACGVKDRLPLVVMGLLALALPTWIARQFGHPALCAHWLLLFGAATAVDASARGLRGRHVAAFCLLFGLAVGIHAYHLVPLSLLLAAALVAELVRSRGRAVGHVLASGGLVVVVVAASAAFLGYDVGDGVAGSESKPGFYSMNLDAPWRPAGSGLLGQAWRGGAFTGASDATGGQGIEGYQYLGVGGLGLILVALALACANAEARRRIWSRASSLWPLAVAALVLALWAVGPRAYLGDRLVYDLKLPEAAVKALGVFRAHGRFFWIPAYLLLVGAIVIVWRTLPRKAASGVLIAALALQVVDSAPARATIRGFFHIPLEPNLRVDAQTRHALTGRPWVFAPDYFCLLNGEDITAFSQTAHVAARLGGAISSIATAHNANKGCQQPRGAMLATAPVGDRTVTVIFNDGESRGGRLALFSERTDCYRMKRGILCGRDLGGAGLAPMRRGDFLSDPDGVEGWIPTDTAGQKPPALAEGWDTPEYTGVWSLGTRSVLRLAAASDRPTQVTLQALAYSEQPPRPQIVTVRVDGRAIATLEIDPVGYRPYTFVVPPRGAAGTGPVDVVLEIPGARKPVNDRRALGVGLKEIRYRTLPPEAAPAL